MSFSKPRSCFVPSPPPRGRGPGRGGERFKTRSQSGDLLMTLILRILRLEGQFAGAISFLAGLLTCISSLAQFNMPAIQIFMLGGVPFGPTLPPLVWIAIGAPLALIGRKLFLIC